MTTALARVTPLVEKLKAAQEDFEFYPTTQEIITRVIKHAKRHELDYRYRYRDKPARILDVGAGHGAFLRAWKDANVNDEVLAIERSTILMQELVKFAKVIGTDFHQQTFVDKRVDLLFCNPPYSEYAAWVSRLIRECPCPVMYFVIPDRWEDDQNIKAALNSRKSKHTTIGNFDFLDADRKARANVSLVCVKAPTKEDDLFRKFFLERFPNLKENEETKRAQKKEHEEYVTRKDGLVKRDGLVGALVELYNIEMAKLQANYERVAKVDRSVLGTLGLSIDAIVDTLKEKMDGLKNVYWSELFTELDTVTSRLTTKNARAILETIGGFKTVDFTAENIYATLLWIIENANQYVDKQILEVFDGILSVANAVNYKSNKRVYTDGKYRYMQAKDEMSHVSLDFRVVLERTGGMRDYYGESGRALQRSAQEFISDMLTVATLLGFPTQTNDPRVNDSTYQSSYWEAGKPQMFKTLSGEDLLEVRAFKNGNMHVRMSQAFTLSLNVAVGKLRGWLRSSEEAAEELCPEAAAVFAQDLRLTAKQLFLACGVKSES